MVLDIITAALIVIPMGIGMARGFLYISMRLLGWVGALVGAFFGAPRIRGLLADGFVGDRVHETLEAHFAQTTEAADEATEGLPAILGTMVDQTVDHTVDVIVAALENLILSVIGFLLIALLIRGLLIFVIRPISRRRGHSPVSLLNKMAGLVIGSIEGLLLAFLFLAALIPVMNMSSPETAASIAENLKFSYLAGTLYDGNLLLAMVGNTIS